MEPIYRGNNQQLTQTRRDAIAPGPIGARDLLSAKELEARGAREGDDVCVAVGARLAARLGRAGVDAVGWGKAR